MDISISSIICRQTATNYRALWISPSKSSFSTPPILCKCRPRKRLATGFGVYIVQTAASRRQRSRQSEANAPDRRGCRETPVRAACHGQNTRSVPGHTQRRLGRDTARGAGRPQKRPLTDTAAGMTPKQPRDVKVDLPTAVHFSPMRIS